MRDDRHRQLTALSDLDQLQDETPDGAGGQLLITATCASYPTTAQAVYCCNPVWIDAADTEGATPSFSADSSQLIYAANLGTQVPPGGTYVIGTATGGRVTFRYDG